jgi:hypothetical protein
MRGMIALLIWLFATTAMAGDDPLLARFVGEWTGKGKVRLSDGAEPERIFCRITNTLVNDGTAMEQKGRCAVASLTGAISGLITATGGNSYEGTLDSLASRGAATVTGVSRGGALVLTAEFIDAQTGAPAISTTVLTPRKEGGYHMTSARARPDSSSYNESEIVFAAR